MNFIPLYEMKESHDNVNIKSLGCLKQPRLFSNTPISSYDKFFGYTKYLEDAYCCSSPAGEYPLETVRGRYGGGVRMADWYFQDRPKLSPKQTALLKRLAVGLHGEDLDEMNQILARFAS